MRVALVVAALAACSGDPHDLVVNSQRQSIIGGTKTKLGQFPSVVIVYETKASALCTGTLISPTMVVTAAHCIDPKELGRSSDEIVAETVVIFDAVTFRLGEGTEVKALDVIEHPTHPDFTANPIDFGHDDIALIKLPAPVTDRLTSPIDLTADNNKNGTKTTQVGYGISEAGTDHAGVEYYLTNKAVVGCAVAGPGLLNVNLVCFNEQNGKGQCNGDSGGPAFDQDGHIIGVVSFGDTACTQFGADTRPGQTKQFILDNVPELAAGSCGADRVCNLSCPSDPDCVAVAPYCGDGVMQAGEACDAGSENDKPGSGCAADCTPVAPVCGNAVMEAGEDCDSGDKNGTDGTCTSDCKLVALEMTDDGGGCSSSRSPVGLFGVLAALGLVIRQRRSR